MNEIEAFGQSDIRKLKYYRYIVEGEAEEKVKKLNLSTLVLFGNFG